MRKVLIFTALWLLIVNIFAVLVLNRFNLKADTAYLWISPEDFHQTQSWNPVDAHVNWDSVWYLKIAREGYSYAGANKPSTIAFFPLYPFLIYLTGFLTFGNLGLAGWILSTIFLFLTVIYLYKLVDQFHPGNPTLTVLFLLAYPTAFFLNTVYTESLFMFLTIAAFYYTFKKNFLLAGLLGFLASITRITGTLIIIPLLWEYFSLYGFKGFSFKVLPLLAIPLGTISFFASHYLAYGDFFLFLKVQGWFGRSFQLNQGHFIFFSNPSIVHFAMDISYVAVCAVLVILIARKLRLTYAIYTLLLLVVPLLTGTTMSIGRYIMVAFPIYIYLASLKNEYVRFSWLFSSALLLALDITLFVNNYWAG